MIIAKNIINPYLKQTTKEDTQIILEMYQVLNSTCSNKSQLIKQLINELLKHRKSICENNELQLNLYFILGLYHPTINDLFISSTDLTIQKYFVRDLVLIVENFVKSCSMIFIFENLGVFYLYLIL